MRYRTEPLRHGIARRIMIDSRPASLLTQKKWMLPTPQAGKFPLPLPMWQETLHGDVNQFALYKSALQMWYHLAGDPLVNVYKNYGKSPVWENQL